MSQINSPRTCIKWQIVISAETKCLMNGKLNKELNLCLNFLRFYSFFKSCENIYFAGGNISTNKGIEEALLNLFKLGSGKEKLIERKRINL